MMNDLPDYSVAVKALDEALIELSVVDDEDKAWSLLDYLSQQGWDLVRRNEREDKRDVFWDHATGCRAWAGVPCECYPAEKRGA